MTNHAYCCHFWFFSLIIIKTAKCYISLHEWWVFGVDEMPFLSDWKWTNNGRFSLFVRTVVCVV